MKLNELVKKNKLLKNLDKRIREHTQSVNIKKELEMVGTHILEDIGMDEETLKRERESSRKVCKTAADKI